MSSAEQEIRRRVAARMEAALDLMSMEAFGLAPSSQEQSPETTLNVNDMLDQMQKFVREARRNQIIFRVDMAHQGDMIKHENPTEGTTIELNFVQAQQLHRECPIRLHKVVDEHCANFVPATQFDWFVPTIIPHPPFDVAEANNT